MKESKSFILVICPEERRTEAKEICRLLGKRDFRPQLTGEDEIAGCTFSEAPVGIMGIGIRVSELWTCADRYQNGPRALLLYDPVREEGSRAEGAGDSQRPFMTLLSGASSQEEQEKEAKIWIRDYPDCQVRILSGGPAAVAETAASYFARHARFRALFSPLRVGSAVLKNRIIAAPITKYGYQPAPEEALEEIAAKARGGAGLILLGSTAVNDENSLIFYEASSLDGYRRPLYNEEISLIHQYGALASVQLLHCGMWADMRHRDCAEPVGPDTLRRTGNYQGLTGIEDNQIMDGKMIRALDEEGMQKICDQYAHAAVTAKKMGFDMVMLHFAHGWLPAEFMSPFFNHRTDEYGGCFENRIRFPMRIVEAVRRAVGKNYPIDMRIGAEEYVDGGLKPEEVIRFLTRIQDQIDMVHISSGLDKFADQTAYIESPGLLPHQINVKYARLAKKALHIPVATVGGITMPSEAEEILEAGDADLVALGRALVADPDWVNKAGSGCSGQITPCLRCCSCYGVATEGISQGCAVNPEYSRKLRLTVESTFSSVEKKRVVVVGGGPAGMKAALAASKRGHRVWLLEKEKQLGGLLRISDDDPVKQDMNQLMRNLICQVENSAITVETGCEADLLTVRQYCPDRVIAAVGSVPYVPPIPGIGSGKVMDILSAHRQEENITGETVIIIGAGPSGCELALALAQKGKTVHLVEMGKKIAAEGNHLYRAALRIRLREFHSIFVHTGTACREILPDGIRAAREDGTELQLQGDTIMLAAGMRSRSELAQSFLKLDCEVSLVGDCVRPRRINEAIHEGYFAGWR